MPRPIEALVHVDALSHNLQQARRSAPTAKVWAVIKADAYGHGIERVFPALRAADGLAMLDLAEAERVRRLGWRGPILLLEGVFEGRDLELCSRLHLRHVVHREEQIDWLALHKTHQPHHVYLKLNSGMNRLGFTPDAMRAAWARLEALPQVDEISLMTHFADADGSTGVAQQADLFAEITRDLPGERSLCNSAAVLLHGATAALRGDWVRPGIMLYGSAPDHPRHDIHHWGLMPTQTLRSQLIGIQHLQPGDRVGYGGAFQAERSQRVGVVACGYADGYPRHAATGTPVLVNGLRTRTLGRVSMDMLAVDLTNLPEAAPGSEVTLWGRAANGAVLPIDEVAQAAGTVGYELMCAVAARVAMRAVDPDDALAPR
ncbi:MAG: alanine racemase [Burkholderiales bacterium]